MVWKGLKKGCLCPKCKVVRAAIKKELEAQKENQDG